MKKQIKTTLPKEVKEELIKNINLYGWRITPKMIEFIAQTLQSQDTKLREELERQEIHIRAAANGGAEQELLKWKHKMCEGVDKLKKIKNPEKDGAGVVITGVYNQALKDVISLLKQ